MKPGRAAAFVAAVIGQAGTADALAQTRDRAETTLLLYYEKGADGPAADRALDRLETQLTVPVDIVRVPPNPFYDDRELATNAVVCGAQASPEEVRLVVRTLMEDGFAIRYVGPYGRPELNSQRNTIDIRSVGDETFYAAYEPITPEELALATITCGATGTGLFGKPSRQSETGLETAIADALAAYRPIDIWLSQKRDLGPESEVAISSLGVDPARINRGYRRLNDTTLLDALGNPGDRYETSCSRPAETFLRRHISPVAAAGMPGIQLLRPAARSVERILRRVEQDDPHLRKGLTFSGALCVRLVPGSTTRISVHSWGAAVDVTMLDGQEWTADGKTPVGLAKLARYFLEEGWLWGAGFDPEDSAHFEVSGQLFDAWLENGALER